MFLPFPYKPSLCGSDRWGILLGKGQLSYMELSEAVREQQLGLLPTALARLGLVVETRHGLQRLISIFKNN